VPVSVDFRTAAAVTLQGMTAQYLACSTYPLKPGDTCLIHAGAGGVGQLLIQVAKMRGARVFANRLDQGEGGPGAPGGGGRGHLYSEQDFEAEVMRLTAEGRERRLRFRRQERPSTRA